MSRSQRSQSRRAEAQNAPARRGTELLFRCRDHSTLRAISVWVMDDDSLQSSPHEALRPDPDTGTTLLVADCPTCLRPVVWTEAALRTEASKTRRDKRRRATIRF